LELETDTCVGYEDLEDGGAWGAKNDPTCCAKELYSDILDGDVGLEAIADLVKLAEKNNWRAGGGCGYHLHIDMRQENNDSLFAAAYAYRITERMWARFVSARRCSDSYCHPIRWSCADLIGYGSTFSQFARTACRGRYEWVNIAAYNYHSTFEIRLHHGTCNKHEIINWVKAHIRFVDWATTLGFDKVREKMSNLNIGELFDLIASEAWQDNDLRAYYAAKGGYNGI